MRRRSLHGEKALPVVFKLFIYNLKSTERGLTKTQSYKETIK